MDSHQICTAAKIREKEKNKAGMAGVIPVFRALKLGVLAEDAHTSSNG